MKAKVVLVEPESLRVVWMNEAAAEHLDLGAGDADIPFTEVVPMAESLGVPDALRKVAETGEPEHMRADVVSMNRGSITIVGSIYRLPDGRLLVVTEHAWQQPDRSSRPRGGRPRGSR